MNRAWPAPAADAFRGVFAQLQELGWDEGDVEALIAPPVQAADFLRLHGALGLYSGGRRLTLLLDLKLTWPQIMGAEATLGAPTIIHLCDAFREGGPLHRFNARWLKSELTTVYAAPDADTVRDELAQTYPNSNFVVNGVLIDINGRVTLSASKIKELISKNEFAGLVDATERLGQDANHQDSKETLRKLGTSGSHRLRYDSHRTEARTFILSRLPQAGQKLAFDVLWNAADVRGQNRAFDIKSGHSTNPGGAANLNGRSAEYAIGRNPASLTDFVNFFEFYWETYLEKVNEYRRLAATLLAKGTGEPIGEEEVAIPDRATAFQVAADYLFGEGTVVGANKNSAYAVVLNSPPSHDEATASYNAYAQAVGAENAVGTLTLNALAASPDAQGGELRARADALRFSADSSAAYHVLKHHAELPYVERQGILPRMKVREYIDSARTTVKQGTWRINQGQYGGDSHYFTRAGLTAIVAVTGTAQAFFATYFRK